MASCMDERIDCHVWNNGWLDGLRNAHLHGYYFEAKTVVFFYSHTQLTSLTI